MYSRILVPLDGSALSEQVLPYAQSVAQGLNAPITLLAIVDPRGYDAPGRLAGPGDQSPGADARPWAEDYLEKTASSLRDAGVSVRTQVRQGEPASEILAEASQEASTLLAMSAHGRSGIGRWMLGGVTRKVVDVAQCPVLVVRSHADGAASPELPLSSIIVPQDGSPTAEQVLPHVVSLAKGLRVELTLLRVVAPDIEYYAGHLGGLAGRASGRSSVDALAGLRETAARLRAEGVERVGCVVLQGDPAGIIIDMARATKHNLVAITTHGRSGLQRWFMGSVADRVVHYSGDPVLLVRTRA